MSELETKKPPQEQINQLIESLRRQKSYTTKIEKATCIAPISDTQGFIGSSKLAEFKGIYLYEIENKNLKIWPVLPKINQSVTAMLFLGPKSILVYFLLEVQKLFFYDFKSRTNICVLRTSLMDPHRDVDFMSKFRRGSFLKANKASENIFVLSRKNEITVLQKIKKFGFGAKLTILTSYDDELIDSQPLENNKLLVLTKNSMLFIYQISGRSSVILQFIKLMKEVPEGVQFDRVAVCSNERYVAVTSSYSENSARKSVYALELTDGSVPVLFDVQDFDPKWQNTPKSLVFDISLELYFRGYPVVILFDMYNGISLFWLYHNRLVKLGDNPDFFKNEFMDFKACGRKIWALDSVGNMSVLNLVEPKNDPELQESEKSLLVDGELEKLDEYRKQIMQVNFEDPRFGYDYVRAAVMPLAIGLRDDSEGNNHNGGQNGYELASQNVVSTIGEVITPRKLVEEIIQKGQPTGSKKVDRLALGITKELEHPEEPRVQTDRDHRAKSPPLDKSSPKKKEALFSTPGRDKTSKADNNKDVFEAMITKNNHSQFGDGGLGERTPEPTESYQKRSLFLRSPASNSSKPLISPFTKSNFVIEKELKNLEGQPGKADIQNDLKIANIKNLMNLDPYASGTKFDLISLAIKEAFKYNMMIKNCVKIVPVFEHIGYLLTLDEDQSMSVKEYLLLDGKDYENQTILNTPEYFISSFDTTTKKFILVDSKTQEFLNLTPPNTIPEPSTKLNQDIPMTSITKVTSTGKNMFCYFGGQEISLRRIKAPNSIEETSIAFRVKPKMPNRPSAESQKVQKETPRLPKLELTLSQEFTTELEKHASNFLEDLQDDLEDKIKTQRKQKGRESHRSEVSAGAGENNPEDLEFSKKTKMDRSNLSYLPERHRIIDFESLGMDKILIATNDGILEIWSFDVLAESSKLLCRYDINQEAKKSEDDITRLNEQITSIGLSKSEEFVAVATAVQQMKRGDAEVNLKLKRLIIYRIGAGGSVEEVTYKEFGIAETPFAFYQHLNFKCCYNDHLMLYAFQGCGERKLDVYSFIGEYFRLVYSQEDYHDHDYCAISFIDDKIISMDFEGEMKIIDVPVV